MNNPIRISAKNLGYTALSDFCPRCYWLRLKTGFSLPYQSFPGIFSSIDAFTKHCVHEVINKAYATKNYPAWLDSMSKDGNKIVGYELVKHWSKTLYHDEKSGITLSGMPDDILVRSDDSKVLPDWKTAKISNTQDKLLPMYEIQINVYEIIVPGCKGADLFLVYMEPQTDKSIAYNHATEHGFSMDFHAVTLPIKNDRSIVRKALTTTRDILELTNAPDARSGCKDCAAFSNLVSMLESK